ncbi:S49 family peptidase [Deinococcus hohokamensis]|uniref:S49 family peptidase n=1 Tax=Deinococcus hohokamensis TaxID=309883 RepID=A0ABV9I468_9DEIO
MRNVQFLTKELSGNVWAITPQMLDHLQQLSSSGKAMQAVDENVTPQATVQKVPLVKANGRNVGVVTFHGVVINRCPAWATYYGYLSPQIFAAEIRQLADDPTVASIVISVDSPGGTVAGTIEAADAVAYAKGKKRVTAVVNDMACSAALWVAAQASEIVVSPTSITGSIGCIISHADYSKALSDWGVLVTYIRSAAKKALGQPYEPLSDAAKAEFQKMVDKVHAQFIAAVAKGRRKSRAVAAEWATGEVWTGADAITAGLADRLGSLSTVVGEATGAIVAPEPAPAPSPADDPEDDDPEALASPPPAATSDPPPPAAEQNASPTDDPPASTEAGSSIAPDPALDAQEDPMNIATISAKLAAGEALTAEERAFLNKHLDGDSGAGASGAPAGQPAATATTTAAANVDTSTLSPEVKALLDQANARAEQAERTANTERDNRLNREFRERAIALGQPASFGSTLRAAHEKMSAEDYKVLEQSLNATGAQLALVGEAGSSQDRRGSTGNVQTEYDSRVQAAMKEDPKLSRAAAGQKVMRDDPQFAARYRGGR